MIGSDLLNKKIIAFTALLLALNLTACNSMYFVESGALASFDVQKSLGIEFPS